MSAALPDWFPYVAEDVFKFCRPRQGLWVDLGSGSGGLGLALVRLSDSTILLVDPNAKALTKGLEKVKASGLAGRIFAACGIAESIPLLEGCVDLVVSRGSIFFWKDAPQGLREVWRILRPGGRAMIGGGFGTSYPKWAYKEFFGRRYKDLKAEGEEAVQKWDQPRRPEWLTAQASAAGLEDFLGPTPPGLWLIFEKE